MQTQLLSASGSPTDYNFSVAAFATEQTLSQAHRPTPVIQANSASVRRWHSAPSKQVLPYHYWQGLGWPFSAPVGPAPQHLYLTVWGPHCVLSFPYLFLLRLLTGKRFCSSLSKSFISILHSPSSLQEASLWKMASHMKRVLASFPLILLYKPLAPHPQ